MAEPILSKAPLFEGIKPNDIDGMLTRLQAVRKEYRKGEYIVWEGDRVKDVGILLSGSAQAVKTNANGKTVIVKWIEPGHYIGVLLAASHDRISPVSVRALENLTVLMIPIQNIMERYDCPCHMELIGNLLNGIAEKALFLQDRNNCLIKSTVRDKVLTLLFRYADTAGSKSFTLPMSRNEMAEYLNVDRSALSRELSRMKKDRLIRYEKKQFELLRDEGSL